MVSKFKDVKDIRWLKRYLRFVTAMQLSSRKGAHLHHILPKKLYPEVSNLSHNKWNGAILSYRAHYLAHYMLAKALHGSMWYAWNRMNNSSQGLTLNSRVYKEAKEAYSKVISEAMILNNPMHNPASIEKMRISNTGRKPSEATKLLMSKASKGKPKNYKMKQSTRDALSETSKGNTNAAGKRTTEQVENIRKGCHGKHPLGLDHPKVVKSLVFDNFNRVKYVIEESLTSFNKKVEEPILKFSKQKGRYKTRFRKYKKYENYLLLPLGDIIFKTRN